MTRGGKARGSSPRAKKGKLVEDQDKPTLTDAVGRALLSFEVNKKTFCIRQPLPDEYDDADALKTLTYNRTLAQDYVKDVADLPCSEGERMLFQLVQKNTQDKFDALDEHADPTLKDQLVTEIARLQGEVESRTLAQEFASDKATLTRDRWLTIRLLCDDQGKTIFDVHDKDFVAKWANFNLQVKDAARPVIWRALSLVREAPFL